MGSMFWFFTQITSLSSPDTKTSHMKQPFLPLSKANPLAQAVLTSPTSTQSASSVMPCAPGSGSWLCPSLGTEASFGRTRAPEGISPGPVPQAALCHKPPPALARARPCSPGTQPCGSSSAWASQEPGHRRRQRDQGLPPRPCKRPLQALPSAPQPCPSNAH